MIGSSRGLVALASNATGQDRSEVEVEANAKVEAEVQEKVEMKNKGWSV